MLGRIVLCMALCAGAAQARDAPNSESRRVVSFNLCADQLVLALADPSQIAGLSPYAADPALSVMADKARAFRKLDWQAESTIALQPDLVFVGPNDRSMTRRMLISQGLRVVEAGFVSDLDSARRQIREMAELLGQKERGDKLLADLERARARLAAVSRKGGETALAPRPAPANFCEGQPWTSAL